MYSRRRSDIESFALDSDASILMCRDILHAWTAYTVKRDGDEWLRTLRCTRCDTQKVTRFSERGSIISNKYIYPDGYKASGLGFLDRDDRAVLRLSLMTRMEE